MEWKKLPEVCDIKTGKRDANHAKENGKYRFYTCANHYSLCDTYSFSGESIIVPGNGDIGLVFYYDGNFEAYQRTYVLSSIKICVKYLYYYFVYKWRSQNTSKQFGSTVKYVRMQNFNDFIVPVPPLPEQQRIVAKIEELFAELDNSVVMLKKAKEQLEVYRQAVLNSAFQNIEKFDTIENLSDFVTSGSRGWAKFYSDDGALFFRIGNLTRDSILINRTNVQHVLLKDNTEGLRTKLVDGDVIISITADIGSIGYVTVLTEDAYVNQHIALVRFKNKNLGKFYAYFLRSDYGQKQLKRNQRGAGKLGLGLDDVRNTHIPVVSEEVSSKTIFEIEFELNKYEKLKNVIDTSLQQADALRQSILKKAFEEELL